MTETTPDEQNRDQIIRAAYTAAGRRLRDAHHDEFLGYQIDECKARGLDWEPKQTPEQRAASEFDRLLEEYPFLRDRLPLDGPAEDTAQSA
jgi:hypothetical protein